MFPGLREDEHVKQRNMPTTEEKWKKTLTPQQYHILREKGTERPFSGRFAKHHEKGVYVCAGCGEGLFSSDAKFESGTGWPSFRQAVSDGKVQLREDTSFFMRRTEALCGRCGGHLGHVFDDGPKPTEKRYRINSAALDFKKT